jgi:hypothetical protein
MADPSRRDVPTLLGTRRTLADIEAAIMDLGGSASPRAALAELTRRLAHDVAGYFDDLPLRLFRGYLPRAEGALGYLLPVRQVPHRLLLARYRGAAPWYHQPLSRSYAYVTLGILAIGVDGVLRRGSWKGNVPIPQGGEFPQDVLPASHEQLTNIPTGTVVLTEWTGTVDADDVAAPSQVIVALKEIATKLAEDNRRDLDLLRQHL